MFKDVLPLTWCEQSRAKYGEHLMNCKEDLWRTLKALTEEGCEARKIISSVRDEDGFQAWHKLNMHYNHSLAARHGRVLAELTAMGTSPAKSPQEIRQELTELEQKIKTAEDITGELISEVHEDQFW